MKRIFSVFFFVVLSFCAQAQMKLIKKLLSNEKDTTRKASFLPLPTFGYSQEVGFEFGVGAIYSVYADRKDTLTRSSNFYTNLSYSTKKTYNFQLRGDAWSKGNKYHAIADLRFRKLPFYFYGIGNSTQKANQDDIVLDQIRTQFDLEKQLLKNAFTGLSLAYEHYKFKDKVPDGLFNNDNSIKGKSGGSVFYLGVSQSYDTRNSNNYPTKGFFGRITYQYAPNLFGGDNFSGSQIKLNLTNFWGLSNKFVLGAQGVYQTIQGKNTPFYLLQQLGNDQIMRGYYMGRYRDDNLVAFQTELRYRYNNRLGAVIFAGTGTVWGLSDFGLKAFKPNYGGGFRYFFDPAKGISIRLDYGIGEKIGTEKRQSGFYISLGESF